MLFNLFLLGCIYLFLPIIYFQFKNSTKAKKGMILSVTLPAYACEDPQVQEHCRRFTAHLRILFWCLTIVLLPFVFVPYFSVALIVGFVWMDIAMAAIFLFYGKANGQMKEIKRSRGWRTASDTSTAEDNDEYWIGGQFYCNPNDRRLLVPDRMGANLNTNLAKPFAKVVYAVSVLMLLALPLVGVWATGEEFAPVTVSVQEQTVIAQHNGSEYAVSLDNVTEAKILQQLPKTWKQSGSSMPNLCKGRFTVEGYGICRVCLDPNAEAFLLLQTQDDTWIFSGEKAVLQQILEVIP